MCLFCKIINKELPADILYEDDDVIAIKDINPLTKDHTLVIPKKHARNMLDVDDDSLSKVMITAKNLAKKHIDANLAKGFNIIVNNEPEANQAVFHLHVHIVYRNDINDIHYLKAKK